MKNTLFTKTLPHLRPIFCLIMANFGIVFECRRLQPPTTPCLLHLFTSVGPKHFYLRSLRQLLIQGCMFAVDYYQQVVSCHFSTLCVADQGWCI